MATTAAYDAAVARAHAALDVRLAAHEGAPHAARTMRLAASGAADTTAYVTWRGPARLDDLVSACGGVPDGTRRLVVRDDATPVLRCVRAAPNVTSATVGHLLRVRPRSVADGCACTWRDPFDSAACTSNGVDVAPYCGCERFKGADSAWCYTQGACADAEAATFFDAALLKRNCDRASPPPPQPGACTDPAFARQWHHALLRTSPAWAGGARGNGTTIVVLDDGVELDHPDLRVDRARSFGWSDDDGVRAPSAGAPRPDHRHGTACAGVAAAIADNDRGGCGVAPGADVVSVRVLSADRKSVDPAHVHEAVASFRDDARTVLSNSWGPDDGTVGGPHAAEHPARATLDGLADGRGGRGTIALWAAGNGGPYDNANDDGFVAHPLTLAVGAVGDDGRPTEYSEFAACLDVVAPSSSWRGVVTADRTGAAGLAAGGVTDAFGGTSAATPMVAGVVALLLEVRPDLGLRDVRHLLAATARRVDPDDQSWIVNGAGVAHSAWYGFGLVDAAAAVEAAATWTLLPRAADMARLDAVARDAAGPPWRVQREAPTLELRARSTARGRLDGVTVTLEVTHAHRYDLEVWLVTPAGTMLPLALGLNAPQYANDAFVAHGYLARGALNESAAGEWTDRVETIASPGSVHRATLTLHGAAEPRDDDAWVVIVLLTTVVVGCGIAFFITRKCTGPRHSVAPGERAGGG